MIERILRERQSIWQQIFGGMQVLNEHGLLSSANRTGRPATGRRPAGLGSPGPADPGTACAGAGPGRRGQRGRIDTAHAAGTGPARSAGGRRARPGSAAVILAAALGLWRWAHRDDEVWIEDDGCSGGYVQMWEYEEERYEEER